MPSAVPSAQGQYIAPPAQGQYVASPSGYAPQGQVYQPQPYVGPTDVPPGAYGPPPGAYGPPPGAYGPPPGAVIVEPQPYPYPYRHHGPYGPPLVLVPAPPLASQQWSVAIDALFLERNSGGGIPLGYSVYNPSSGLPPALPTENLYSDDALFPLEAGVRLEISH